MRFAFFNLKYKIGDKFIDCKGIVREIIDIDSCVLSSAVDVYELDIRLNIRFGGLRWVSEEFIDYNFKPYNQEGNNKKLDKLISGFDETVELEG